jgi:ribosomal protein S18 acetylase RimI-like enzyme
MTGMIFEIMNHNHVEGAAKIAFSEFFEERASVPALPDFDFYESLCKLISELADSDLGTVALENGKVVGYLTCYQPMQNHFGTTPGVFSPLHGHGTVKENRAKTYSWLYQKASEKWLRNGILSHAISLYAHSEAIQSFFWNGFGLRCIDAIREVIPIQCGVLSTVKFREIPHDELSTVVTLKNQLIKHLRNTPMYIPLFFQVDTDNLKEEAKNRKSRFFAAEANNEVVGFIEIMDSGENFACEYPGMMNICGAYLIPDFRGQGIFHNLLDSLLEILKSEGYTHCGVDFESFNPTASGFWLKHFMPYTYSVTRRIDERIIKSV